MQPFHGSQRQFHGTAHKNRHIVDENMGLFACSPNHNASDRVAFHLDGVDFNYVYDLLSDRKK